MIQKTENVFQFLFMPEIIIYVKFHYAELFHLPFSSLAPRFFASSRYFRSDDIKHAPLNDFLPSHASGVFFYVHAAIDDF